MSGPLRDVRVIDLTSVVLGPYATQILADFGADVIKVETADGDVLRHVGVARHPGMGSNFLHMNRNKRSIVLDLKQPAGRDALLRLVETADVLVYNMRPQAMARLGLRYADCAAVNPRLLYVGAFGYGQDGPYAEKPAYDDLVQGAAGISRLLEASGATEPRYAPLTLCDHVVGLNTANVVMAALYHRERSGEGQSIDVPMFETMAEFVLGDHMGGRTFDPPAGPTGYTRVLSRDRRPYRTQDGYVAVLVYNDKQWQSFFRLIGREDLTADPRFSSHTSRAHHIDEVYAFVAETILGRTTAAWLEGFAQADIPAMPVYTPDELINDPHLAAVGFFREVEHPTEGRIRMMRTPSRWTESQPAYRHHAPVLGQHTAEVLREHGYADADIDAMLATGAARAAAPLAR